MCSVKKSEWKQLPRLNEFSDVATPHAFDVLNYTIRVNLYTNFFSPYPNNFQGFVTVTFRVDSTLSTILLDANSTSLTISSVGLAGVSYTHSGNILAIDLDRTYVTGETASISIAYEHLNISDGAFYSDNGMIFTDCEPEGARKWFPCWDKPADKATLDLTAKVPATVRFGSNGTLADSTLSGDTLTYHWISDVNIATYLMVMTGKTDYKLDIVYWRKISNPYDSIPIRFYYHPGENPSAIKEIIGAMTTFFSQHFCEYPFSKNGFATLNNQFVWGGMENQTLISLCPNCWIEWLIAHEFAHQWFGDMITCATWADIWLNEGFATWGEAYWRSYAGGYPAYKNTINNEANTYLNNNPGWAISNPDWAVNTPSPNVLFNYAITYCKGACVLHMLRYMLGDPVFFQIIQSYCTDTNFRFQSATISDFMGVVNSVTGQNQDWFFNQWLFAPNHPVYENEYYFAPNGSGSWKVKFLCRQTQNNAPFFKMPVQVKIKFSDNRDTTVWVMNDTNEQVFTWNFSKQPASLTFDPDLHIVLKQATTTISGVTVNRKVEDVTISAGQSSCFDALETITVAGSGTLFSVESGGSASFIAGQQINFLPGTTVYPGGYLHGMITPNWDFCGLPDSFIATSEPQDKQSLHPDKLLIPSQSVCRIYPNPTCGVFTLELISDPGISPICVVVLDVFGKTLFSEPWNGITRMKFSLAGSPPGIYLVRIIYPGQTEILKVIKEQ